MGGFDPDPLDSFLAAVNSSLSQPEIDPAAVLGSDAWNAHLPLLPATYPDWSFAPDFHG